MMLQEVDQLLKPGYLPVETGYSRLANGDTLVAVLTLMPGCKGKWVEWWFGTHLADKHTFRQWDPAANLNYRWEGSWKPGDYIGSSHYVELLMAGNIFKLKFKYIDPAIYFDISRFKEANISAAICEEGYNLDGTLANHSIILIRDTDYGCEMRTRCWIHNGTDEMGMLYLQHFLSGMRNLSESLKYYIEESQKSRDRTNVVCKYCNSKDVVKNGLHKNLQYWRCRTCGHGFLNNHNLPKMRYSLDTMANAVNNYYAGDSITHICRGIEPKYNVLPSSSTVHGWIKKLTKIALNEEQKYHPQVSDTWMVSESEIRLNGPKYRLLSVADRETQFLLSIKLCGHKTGGDIQSLILRAGEKAGKTPQKVFINGGKENRSAVRAAFGGKATIRIRPFTAEMNAYFTRFWRGTIIERLKPHNGLDGGERTQIVLDGLAFHYNYIRLNEKLGRISAQAAGTKFPFGSWIDIIRNGNITQSQL